MHAQVEMMAIIVHVQVPSRSLAIQVHVQMYAEEQKHCSSAYSTWQVKHGYSIGRVWSPSCGAVLQMRQSNITHVSLNANCLVKTRGFEMQAIAFSRLQSQISRLRLLKKQHGHPLKVQTTAVLQTTLSTLAACIQTLKP